MPTRLAVLSKDRVNNRKTEKFEALNKFPHEPRTEFPLGRYGRRRRQEDNKMPFTQKANSCGLFENDRAPDKSDLCLANYLFLWKIDDSSHTPSSALHSKTVVLGAR